MHFMPHITELPKSTKPISKEALVKCIEALFADTQMKDRGLIRRIMEDATFDVAIVSSPEIHRMTVELCKYDGEVPIYTTYCGHTIEKILALLPYAVQYKFPGTIRLEPMT